MALLLEAHMKDRRGFFSIIVIFAFGLLIGACSGTATQAVLPPTDTPVLPVVVEPTEEVIGQVPTEEIVAEPTQAEVVPPTEEPQKPELKTSLVATNPGDVNLASGKHTLVEFFAFW